MPYLAGDLQGIFGALADRARQKQAIQQALAVKQQENQFQMQKAIQEAQAKSYFENAYKRQFEDQANQNDPAYALRKAIIKQYLDKVNQTGQPAVSALDNNEAAFSAKGGGLLNLNEKPTNVLPFSNPFSTNQGNSQDNQDTFGINPDKLPALDPNYVFTGKGDMFQKDNSIALQEKQDQFNQRQWTTFINKNTPGLASSRSTLGMAANGNLRADRAIATIEGNPIMTYQDLGNVVGDLAGIYQGGAPTDMAMKHQQYESIQAKIANIKQFFTGRPQDAVPLLIKQKITKVLYDLKKVNNDSIKTHYDIVEAGQKKLISNFSDEWKDFRARAEMDAGINQNQSFQSTQGQSLPVNKQVGKKDYSSLWQ